MPTIRQTHNLGGCLGHGILVVANNVANQHHLGHTRTTPLAFGGVAHCTQIAIIEMLKAREQGARALLLGEHERLDVHDARHSVFRAAKKLQANRARVGGHAVHHPTGAGD